MGLIKRKPVKWKRGGLAGKVFSWSGSMKGKRAKSSARSRMMGSQIF